MVRNATDYGLTGIGLLFMLCVAAMFLILLLFLGKERARVEFQPNAAIDLEIAKEISIPKYIFVGDYFGYIDSLVQRYDSLVPYPLSEHLLVRNNPWVIDTLANTDYNRRMEKDSFIYDQRQQIVLPKGLTLKLPDSTKACRMLEEFAHTEIDINMPEFRIRIFQDDILLYTSPIRVGQNRKRYLKLLADHITHHRAQMLDYRR